jgi:DNA-directed RNA polymerase subunit D
VAAGENARTVYSGELVSENPAIVPVSDKIPIVKLAPAQKIKLEAYARLGKGEKHAKWQPVSVAAFRYFPRVKLDEKACGACGKCVDVCPKRVLAMNADGKKLDLRNVTDCTVCKDCLDVCPASPPALEVSWDKGVFVFDVESTGALPVERIVVEASKILDKKAASFLEQLAVKKDEEAKVD